MKSLVTLIPFVILCGFDVVVLAKTDPIYMKTPTEFAEQRDRELEAASLNWYILLDHNPSIVELYQSFTGYLIAKYPHLLTHFLSQVEEYESLAKLQRVYKSHQDLWPHLSLSRFAELTANETTVAELKNIVGKASEDAYQESRRHDASCVLNQIVLPFVRQNGSLTSEELLNLVNEFFNTHYDLDESPVARWSFCQNILIFATDQNRISPSEELEAVINVFFEN